jgi:hypothetical protein
MVYYHIFGAIASKIPDNKAFQDKHLYPTTRFGLQFSLAFPISIAVIGARFSLT